MKKILTSILAVAGLTSLVAFADDSNRVLFSGVEGYVLLDGKPVSGATVIRRYKWSHKNEIVDSTFITDNKGYFKFEKVLKGLFPLYLMTDPRVMQEIIVNHNDNEYRVWLYFKSNTQNNSEIVSRYDRVQTGNGYAMPTNLPDIKLNCELNSENRKLFEPEDTWITPPNGKCTLIK